MSMSSNWKTISLLVMISGGASTGALESVSAIHQCCDPGHPIHSAEIEAAFAEDVVGLPVVNFV